MTDSYPTPLDDAALDATWAAAWAAFGQPAPAGLQAELMTAWSEPHRHHHDQQHLRECLALWTRWRHHSAHPGEVAIALWFHDAIYSPQDGDSELNSAVWAARSLSRADVDTDTAQRIFDLVMATQHGSTQETALAAPRSSRDAQLLVDIDLAILGSPAARFEQYEQDVRREHAAVAIFRYQKARAQVLQGFLDRPRLYHGPHAVALLDAQARTNLAAALKRLEQ